MRPREDATCIVAFADAMGTTHLVSSAGMREDYLERIKRAAPAAQRALSHAVSRSQGFAHHGYSDSIVLTAPSSEPRSLPTMLRTLADLQVAYFREGIMLRGGISSGMHETQTPIEASLPLLECVWLDTKGHPPRIALHESIARPATQSCAADLQYDAALNVTYVDWSRRLSSADALRIVMSFDRQVATMTADLHAHVGWIIRRAMLARNIEASVVDQAADVLDRLAS